MATAGSAFSKGSDNQFSYITGRCMDEVEIVSPGISDGDQQAAARRRTRRWLPLSFVIIVILLAATAAYDLLPNLTLNSRIDTFMEIARPGEPRQKVNAALASEGFPVPKPDPPAWNPPPGGRTDHYLIRTREPILERLVDRVSIMVGFDKWYAEKKPPHQAFIRFDENDRISGIEFSSRFSPLGL